MKKVLLVVLVLAFLAPPAVSAACGDHPEALAARAHRLVAKDGAPPAQPPAPVAPVEAKEKKAPSGPVGVPGPVVSR